MRFLKRVAALVRHRWALAPIVQKHCLDTASSDVYDLDVHKKLQEASFNWTEGYAIAYEARTAPQPGIENEEPSTVMTGDSTTEEVEHTDDFEPVLDEPSAPAAKPSSRRKATTVGDIVAASPSPAKKPKRAPEVPMASLPSVSRNKTQQIPVDALMEEEDEITASSDWDSDASFEIELISGGTTIGDERSHRIKWRGCHDTFKNWWQTIPEDHSVTGEEYIGMKTTVFVSIG